MAAPAGQCIQTIDNVLRGEIDVIRDRVPDSRSERGRHMSVNVVGWPLRV